jgi:membrane-associated phospholipid phosphatase
MNRTSQVRLVCCSLAVATCLHAGSPALAQTAATPLRPSNLGSGAGTLFDDLVTTTLTDFGRFPSRETLAWVSVGAAIAAFGHTADRETSSAMSASRSLETVFGPGESLGGARMQMIGAAATYAIGRFTGSRRAAQVGAALVRAQILTQGVTAAIKMSVRRGRPDGTHFSFPSGHSSVTFASATVLQRNFGWKAGAPAYAMAAWVAASRVQMKRHHLSDVIVGATVGILAGRAVTIGEGDNTFAVTPTVVPGGAGVSFTRISR